MPAKKEFKFPETIYVIPDPYAEEDEEDESLLAFAAWPEHELSKTKPTLVAIYSLDSQGRYVVETKIVKKGG